MSGWRCAWGRLLSDASACRSKAASSDGRQPDVGHEGLWVVREGLSGEGVVARSRLASAEQELAPRLREAVAGLEVPVVGVVSDGPHAVRHAIAEGFPGPPHQLCQFHSLRQAAGPIWEADRHAKKERKKQVRKLRPLERAVEGRQDAEAEIVPIVRRCAGP
jgi:hypothetical protein